MSLIMHCELPQFPEHRARVAVHGPSFQKALKAGVKIVFGTDAGSFEWTDPNSPIAAEFGRMVEFGMTPVQAIRSATSMPAVMLNMEGQIGVVAPGAFADIIAVQGDPLRDVNVLKNVGFVVKDGKVFKNDVR
jgi:imidazolonepropionase-like amidohydrolase